MEFLRTLEDGIRLVPDLERLERVEQFKVRGGGTHSFFYPHFRITSTRCCCLELAVTWIIHDIWLVVILQLYRHVFALTPFGH